MAEEFFVLPLMTGKKFLAEEFFIFPPTLVTNIQNES